MQNNSKVGGILSIISGSVGVLWVGFMVFSIYMLRFMFDQPYMPYSSASLPGFLDIITIIYSAWGIFFALVGALGITGGIFALKKER